MTNPKPKAQSNDIWKLRAITLLNMIYKIYAKVVSRFLSMLIHSLQTKRVKEKSILDTIVIFWEETNTEIKSQH